MGARRASCPRRSRALLSERLKGRPTRANFRTGHLTICTLMPMRSVPHRVVCLLGMDDGVFPRKSPRDGDDLMLADPHVGDRDARTEDRQLLLDALLAATDQLIVTYTGNDERTNLVRPPAVPIGELLDVIDRTVRTDGQAGARRRSRYDIRSSRSTPRTSPSASSCPSARGASTPSRSTAREALTDRTGAAGAVPRRAAAAAGANPRGTRGPRALRRPPRPRLPAPAARHQRRGLRRRGRRRAAGRARRAGALGRRAAAARRGPRRREHRGLHRGRDRPRDAAPRQARDARHRPHPPDRRAHRGRGRTPSSTPARSRPRSTSRSRSPTAAR